MRSPAAVIVLLVAALILPACATIATMPTPADAASATALPHDLPPVVEALPDFPGSVGATQGIPWEPPPGMGEADTTHDSVASLLLDLRRFWDTAESEVRVGLIGEPTEDAASAYLQAMYPADGTVAGTEIAFQVRRGERGWYMTDARARAHCRRGVDLDAEQCV